MEFLFIGNNLASDFVNTEVVGFNDRIDLLHSPESLLQWFNAALGESLSAKLTEKELADAKELRSSIRRAFERAVESNDLLQEDIDLLNQRSNMLVRVLKCSNHSYKLDYRLDSGADLLAMIATACCELLASTKLKSLRKCASDKCILYFVDTSKNQQRQWCSMETCGNREKVRKHYDKTKSR